MTLAVAFAGCRNGSPVAGPPTSTRGAGTRGAGPTAAPDSNVTTGASTAPTSATTATVASAPECQRIAKEWIAAAQPELTRLDPLPLDALKRDAAAADLSDTYYETIDGLEGEAEKAGCNAARVARLVLEGTEAMGPQGPVAAAAQAAVVDELAWRISKPLPRVPLGEPITVEVAGPREAISVEVTDCAAVGAQLVPIYQALLDSLASVPVERYLIQLAARSTDIRTAVGEDVGGGMRLLGAQFEAAVFSTVDNADRLGCSDEVLSAQFLERATSLRATSPTAIVFKADQIDLAVLLLTGL